MLKYPSITSREYRDCMARLAGAVSIITTAGEHGRRGVTVSAVTSVSDNPPTLLVCLNRNRPENAVFGDNGCFALNLLNASEIELARVFAGEGHLDMDERFARAKWRALTTGAPVLSSARMTLDCRVIDVKPVATHDVIMGEVVAGTLGIVPKDQKDEALIYLDREYRAL